MLRRDVLRSGAPLAIAVLGGLGVAACRQEPIRQPTVLTFVNRGGLADRGEQIRRAASDLGWITRQISHGAGSNAAQNRRGGPSAVIEATNNRDGHNVVVNIIYDTRTYQIRYISSVGLNYDGRQIHTYYNRQVELLEQRIQRESAL